MSSDELVTRLAEIVGSTHISSALADRASCGDLAPELVVWPGAAREVARVLRTCAEAGVRIGVVGGQTRARRWLARGTVALNTRRMSDILEVDETSLTVHAQCGLRLLHLEQALRRSGLTLGSFRAGRQQGSTLGGAIAAPLPRTHSPRYGRLVDNCVAISVACLDGKVLHTPVVPRSATGPEIKRLHLGAGGRLGVITAAVMRVHRLPEKELAVVQLYPDLERAVAAAREILVRGVVPAMLQVLNQQQATAQLGARSFPLPAVCVVLLAGPPSLVEVQAQVLTSVSRDLDGSELPQQLADGWLEQDRGEPGEAGSAERPAALEGALAPRTFQLPFSRARAVLAALAARLGDLMSTTPIWIDNLTLHGGMVSVGGPDLRLLADESGQAGELRELFVAEPPLLAELRAAIDPDGILTGCVSARATIDSQIAPATL